MFTKVSPGTGCSPWPPRKEVEGKAGAGSVGEVPGRLPRCLQCLLCACATSRGRHTPHKPAICRCPRHIMMCPWVHISQLGPPSQSRRWTGHLQFGKGRQCRLAQRAWAQFASLALGICWSPTTLTVGRWVSGATSFRTRSCGCPGSEPSLVLWAAQVPALGLGNC